MYYYMDLNFLIMSYNKLKYNDKYTVYNELIRENKTICINNVDSYDKINEDIQSCKMSYKLTHIIKRFYKLKKIKKLIFLNYINTQYLNDLQCMPNINSTTNLCNNTNKFTCHYSNNINAFKYSAVRKGIDVSIGMINGAIVGAAVGSIFPGSGTITGVVSGVLAGAVNRGFGGNITDFTTDAMYSIRQKLPKNKLLISANNLNKYYFPEIPQTLLRIDLNFQYGYTKILRYSTLKYNIYGLSISKNKYIIKHYLIGNNKPLDIIETSSDNGIMYEGIIKVGDVGKYNISIENGSIIVWSPIINVVTKEELLEENKSAIQLIVNYTDIFKSSQLTNEELVKYSYELFNIVIDEHYINRKYMSHICKSNLLEYEPIYSEAIFYCSKFINREILRTLVELKLCNAVIKNNYILILHIFRMRTILMVCLLNNKLSLENIEKMHNTIFLEMVSIVNIFNQVTARRLIYANRTKQLYNYK